MPGKAAEPFGFVPGQHNTPGDNQYNNGADGRSQVGVYRRHAYFRKYGRKRSKKGGK
jgi:hypothetical protein